MPCVCLRLTDDNTTPYLVILNFGDVRATRDYSSVVGSRAIKVIHVIDPSFGDGNNNNNNNNNNKSSSNSRYEHGINSYGDNNDATNKQARIEYADKNNNNINNNNSNNNNNNRIKGIDISVNGGKLDYIDVAFDSDDNDNRNIYRRVDDDGDDGGDDDGVRGRGGSDDDYHDDLTAGKVMDASRLTLRSGQGLVGVVMLDEVQFVGE
ncbi:hypothetical protein HELRODRAFT_159732 [Helobdella robusta]|uniref:Uncharacterized protein n=1 Tax=Helobdella robusta TaxID=6412 RepID=T1EPC6_HELRO|nr:hypothetical protein HELRODRAFT_159732 [Helobdella robusta]ESO13118.1 hypothetical protein HELRODRAFT_159732 [Helobdella robusta]